MQVAPSRCRAGLGAWNPHLERVPLLMRRNRPRLHGADTQSVTATTAKAPSGLITGSKHEAGTEMRVRRCGARVRGGGEAG